MADLNRHLATPLTYGEARAQNQKSLSAQIDEEAATRLKQSAVETRDTARLNCVARPDAGDWLPKGTWWPLAEHSFDQRQCGNDGEQGPDNSSR